VALVPQIERVWPAKRQVYGADKVWWQMNRAGIPVARCTVERLMPRAHATPGSARVIRGQGVRTTVSDRTLPCPLDRVNRTFKTDRPNQLWVADVT
jgi:putative transposase